MYGALVDCALASFVSHCIWSLQDNWLSYGPLHTDKQRRVRSYRWNQAQSGDRYAESPDLHLEQHKGSETILRLKDGRRTEQSGETKCISDASEQHSHGCMGVWWDCCYTAGQQYIELLWKSPSDVQCAATLDIRLIRHYIDTAANRLLSVGIGHLCDDWAN